MLIVESIIDVDSLKFRFKH